MSEPLLKIQNLQVSATRSSAKLPVVDGASLSIERGERVALVGESGSGKSVTCFSAMGLLPESLQVTDGSIRYQGSELTALGAEKLRRLRGPEIAMIYQEPLTSLNPLLTIGAQLKEAAGRAKAGRREILEMLDRVGFADPPRILRQRPHELSGGMRQRVMIAMALVGRPKLLLADEPTTALDVTIQSQVLKLMYDLSYDLDTAVLIVSHDLSVVRKLADTVHVMYAGQVVESGPVKEVLATPRHPYTQALLDSAPHMGDTRDRLESIPGIVPTPDQWDQGCRFRSRCPLATEQCEQRPPKVEEDDRASMCWHIDRLVARQQEAAV
ncbi:ABC transporter ATP-binding protein [Nesterenkonia ebinurensis]|uniref:ABC transporter ATP-binding protein n=1 Tax=Nesterenkonia ebinurensis TaxID=2608252 RepID=UPI00123C8D79|nr:ABC transporter ATP-binding protein [Nesterenkonia ebinurensis]